MTIDSFCKTVWNLSYNQVRNSINKEDYVQFKIPKKNGFRTITSLPKTSTLYMLQNNFNRYYLQKLEIPVCAKGFVRGENYISYLEPHVGATYFMRMDIKDFFPSITSSAIKEVFSNLITFETEDDKEKILKLISDICTFESVLPQGVPSSPMISNLVMARTDQRITKYCQVLGINYTRYADDMLFSSTTFNFNDKRWFVKKIRFILSTMEFNINYSKLKFGDKEVSLNGYVVSSTGIRLSRSRLTDIKKILAFSKDKYALAKTDPETFLQLANCVPLEHRNLTLFPFKSVFQFTQFLIGYRSYFISFFYYDIDLKFRKKAEKLVKNIEKQLELY